MSRRNEHRDVALKSYSVSRETSARLQVFVEELSRWQNIQNLIGPGTFEQIWTRHIADSLQLLEVESGESWVDLGSGAGFPGLVLGIAASERPGMHVHLVESNGRKCAFLRHVARLTGAEVTIYPTRLENVIQKFQGSHVVTARALAPLPRLLAWTQDLLKAGTIGLFMKGRDARSELTEAEKCWKFEADLLPSRTDAEGQIVRIKSLREH